MVGWVFFRAANFTTASTCLHQMFLRPARTAAHSALGKDSGAHHSGAGVLEEKKEWFEEISLGPAWAYGAVCALLLLSVELIGYTQSAVPFVYFQF